MKRKTLIIFVLFCNVFLIIGQNTLDTDGERQEYDSAHYSIIRRKYITGEKYYENYANNLTKLDSCIEFYKNGRIKEIGISTSVYEIYVGIWRYYSSWGKIIRTVDYNKKYRISYFKALEIAKKKGFVFPNIEVTEKKYKNKHYWEISRWTDKVENGAQVAETILISKLTGEVIKPDYHLLQIE